MPSSPCVKIALFQPYVAKPYRPNLMLHRPNLMLHRPNLMLHRLNLMLHRPNLMLHRLNLMLLNPEPAHPVTPA